MNRVKEQKKILHITPHLGGGVGTVLLNWLSHDKTNQHKVASLDFANDNAKKVCKERGIPLFDKASHEELKDSIKENDIIIIHFWNHPLLYDFLVRNELPACRCVFYSHISGLSAPNLITKKVLSYADTFVYTTPISKEICPTNQVILSTGGADSFNTLPKIPHKGFCAGYIGTVDYTKMHSDYVETLSKTSADKILVVGGDNEKEIAKSADCRFTFTGKVSDIRPYLAQMDIFAYLLNPEHFGTAEQVLQEAMSFGAVPVVLNNKCESSIVEHEKTGLIARNLDEYIFYVERLKNDINLRAKLSQQAKAYAKSNFSLNTFIDRWDTLFNEIMKSDKKSKKWNIHKEKISSFDIFAESLGDFFDNFILLTDSEKRAIFKKSNWNSDSKGTAKHYYKFLSGDKLKQLLKYYE